MSIEFSTRLLSLMDNGTGNTTISPLSLYMPLGILYKGATNNTLKEFINFLPDIQWVDTWIQKMNELQTVIFENRILVRENYKIHDQFKPLVDKVKFNEQTCIHFNDWISGITGGEIKNMLAANSLSNPNIQMVVANAINFSDYWTTKFDKNDTTKSAFFINHANHIFVDMMHCYEKKFDYIPTITGLFDGIHLNFKSNEFQMTILRPLNPNDANKVVEWVKSKGKSALSHLKSRNLTVGKLGIPKFDISSENNMTNVLQQMGIVSAFNGSSGFMGLADDPGLCIGEVRQKVNIKLYEEGAKATAVTMMVMYNSIEKTKPEVLDEFILDRPFVFLIKPKSLEAIAFTGIIRNPNQ